MSLPNLPPPPDQPPPPPPDQPPPPPQPSEVSRTPQRKHPAPPVKQPLKPQAKSRDASHLARSSSGRGSSARVPDKLLSEAEKAADASDSLKTENDWRAPSPPRSRRPMIRHPQAEYHLDNPLTSAAAAAAAASSSSDQPPVSDTQTAGWRRPSQQKMNRTADEALGSRARQKAETEWKENLQRTLEELKQSEFAAASTGIDSEEIAASKAQALKEVEERKQVDHILLEILQTEKSFYDFIKNMQGFFAVLKRIMIQEKSGYKSKWLKKLTPQDLDAMVKNWGDLRDTSRTLILRLEEIVQNDTLSQRQKLESFLDIFSADQIGVHLDNLANLTLAQKMTLKTIEKLKSEPPSQVQGDENFKSQSWILKLEADMQQTIPALVIMPVQRSPRYMLLLKELHKSVSRIAEYEDLAPIAYNRFKLLESKNESLNKALPK